MGIDYHTGKLTEHENDGFLAGITGKVAHTCTRPCPDCHGTGNSEGEWKCLTPYGEIVDLIDYRRFYQDGTEVPNLDRLYIAHKKASWLDQQGKFSEEFEAVKDYLNGHMTRGGREHL